MLEAKEQKDILRDLKIVVVKDNLYLKYQENNDRLKDQKENLKLCLKEVE